MTGWRSARQLSHELRELPLGIITTIVDLIFVFRYPRSVRQQMTQRDRSPPCLRAWQVTSYPVVEAEFSLLSEEHDRSRSELLADRSGLEDTVRGHRYLVLKVCKAVSLGQHDLTVFDDSDSHSGDLLSRHLRRGKSVHRQYRIARRR